MGRDCILSFDAPLAEGVQPSLRANELWIPVHEGLRCGCAPLATAKGSDRSSSEPRGVCLSLQWSSADSLRSTRYCSTHGECFRCSAQGLTNVVAKDSSLVTGLLALSKGIFVNIGSTSHLKVCVEFDAVCTVVVLWNGFARDIETWFDNSPFSQGSTPDACIGVLSNNLVVTFGMFIGISIFFLCRLVGFWIPFSSSFLLLQQTIASNGREGPVPITLLPEGQCIQQWQVSLSSEAQGKMFWCSAAAKVGTNDRICTYQSIFLSLKCSASPRNDKSLIPASSFFVEGLIT